ncbi:MAG: Nramp family divalent metal transporter [Bacteroidota bacterium]|nr:Nramp family divalent metal transporter [Bacteroidota bacterium]
MNKFRAWLGVLGPGMITAALVFGPSKVTITSKLGADHGFDLLWIVVVAIFFMVVFTAMSARIGIASDISFLSLIRKKWGAPAAVASGAGVFLVCASFQAGNSIGIGISIAELFQSSPEPWIIAFNVFGVSLLFFRSFYKVLEKIMIALIIIMLVAFLVTLFLSRPPLGAVAGGLVPVIPAGSFGLVIAFMASCFSVVGACYQSYLMQERRRINPGRAQSGRDSFPGILILGIMSAIVLICAASVLHPQGLKVNSGSDMAKVLEPLFGDYASAFFLIGLFGAAFSSLIGNASLGGTLMADALGHGSSFNSKVVRGLIALVMLIGAVIAIVFGNLPIQLMIFAQSITILVVPFIGIALYLLANDRAVMGDLRNSPSTRVVGALGLVILIGLAIRNVQTLFF